MRIYVINEFNTLQRKAVRNFLITKILRKVNSPRNFEDDRALRLQTKRYAGIQNVRVDQIVGTLGRRADFDGNFRPLKKHLRDRWVNAFLQLNTADWLPIVVHKLDESYYVEDGHHRVSVAQFVGMQFIEAEVWDHTFCPSYRQACNQSRKVVKVKNEVCAIAS
jgi:hypothetical protein